MTDKHAIRRVWLKSSISLLIILIIAHSALGQISISGRVISKAGDALSRINIMLYSPGNSSLVAFAVSDEKGNFKTSVTSKSDSLIIKISSINYRDETQSIANATQFLQFELVYDIKELEGVNVIAPAITKRGDTLNYLVQSFVHTEDKTIEDVLRRMPGIDVEANGQILYQGTPINRFYVEGLDLMEGRYSMVSKNLPKGSVTTVEILENHQPIRMLEDKVESQQAALNLKIKKGVTTTGKAQLGAGVSPFLWDVNITPMTFTKKFQVVTSLQSNNTGNDVSQQLRVFTFEDLNRQSGRPPEHVEMLNILTASPPEIKPNRYLDNNIVLFNFNGLQRINADFKLRTNIYYTHDIQKSHTSIIRTMYTPIDTLKFAEEFNNQLTNNNLYAKFNINRNVKKNYLNNDLKLESGWNTQAGFINTDGKQIAQALKNPLKSISNDLRSYNHIGEHTLQIESFISYENNPNSLGVRPGQFAEVLNDSVPYELVTQKIELNRFYTDNSAGMVFSDKRITFSPRVGFMYQQQSLTSNLISEVNNIEIKMSSEFANDIRTYKNQSYLRTDIEYKTVKMNVSGTIAIKQNKLKITEQLAANNQKLSKLLTNTSFSLNYKPNGFWRLNGSWIYEQDVSDFDETYSGFIMKNYRNLSQNVVPISTASQQQFVSRIEYRNQITSFFNMLSYVYSTGHSNTINNNIIGSNGSAIITSESLPQTTNTHILQAYSSKFFSSTKTTLSLRVNYMQEQGKSLVNGEQFNTKNKVIGIKPELSIHLTPWMNLEYSLDANSIFTFIDNDQKSKIVLTKHNINFFFFPVKNQLFNFTSEYYNHNNKNNLFMDLMYRYTLTKQKIDMEVKCNNIFNAKTYTSFLANAYSVWETTYSLRPFQVIFSVKFSF